MCANTPYRVIWRGEVVRAVFDRSFIDEHGIRWVIDYKTSQHGGGALAEFLDREVERYRPQLQRYALLARKMGPEPVRVGPVFPAHARLARMGALGPRPSANRAAMRRIAAGGRRSRRVRR